MHPSKFLINGQLPVTCCFCFGSLLEPDAVLLSVYPTPERDEEQSIYAHHRCFVASLHPDVPLHPDFDDDERE
jgi:hypothetical protein